MQIEYHKHLKKQYSKLSQKIQVKFANRLKVFVDNPFDKGLNNHPLHGDYSEYRSINVTGDIRAVYEVRGNTVIFLIIDTHSNLY